MLKPSENKISTPHNSQYALVIAVAKRARQITKECEDRGEILIEKPVDLAVRDFVAGKYSIREFEPNGNQDE